MARETRWIRSETPEAEQWRQLGQYRYGPNVRRYLAEHGLMPASHGIEDYVSGSIGQAEAYYTAAKAAPLDISPLLLYYGTTSLLAGVAALLRGSPLPIADHGMAINNPSAGQRMSDVEVVVRNTAGSGLHQYAGIYGDAGQLPGQSKWSLGELLASLPDLKDEVALCLPEAPPYVLRIDTLRKGSLSVDRILRSEFRSAAVDDVLARVPGLKQAYVHPQGVANGIVLYRRLNGSEIATESLSGQKALLVGHEKSGRLNTPGQVLTILMALHALGTASRYNPTLWHPFVRTDATGERLLIERFLALVTRWLPNLILSTVSGTWTRFTSEVIQPHRGLEAISESDLRQLVKEMLREETKQ